MFAGKYIVFEGIDGSGKTTQALKLVDAIVKEGTPFAITREPGSEHIDLKIREMVLSDQPLSPAALEMLLQADRSEHNAWLLEHLQKGYCVVSDRSFISGLAYGLANNNRLDHVLACVDFAVDVLPDYVFFMDRNVDVASKEIKLRGNMTREEKRGIDFARKVRSNFMDLLFSPLGRNHDAYDILDQFDMVCERHRISVWHDVEYTAARIRNLVGV